MGTWKNYLEKFLGHPLVLGILSMAITVAVVIFPERMIQVSLLILITASWIIIGVVRAAWMALQEYYASLPGKIRYTCVIKEIEILNQKGDSNLTFTYHGENLGDTHRDEIFHVIRQYDSVDFPPDKVEGWVDGEKVDVIVKSMAKTKKGDKNPSKYQSKFIMEFPNSVPPNSALPIHSFKVPIKEYCKAFGSKDSTTHTVDVLTDRLLFKVKVKPPLIITHSDFSVSDFHETTDPDELKRLRKTHPIRKHGSTSISWEIPRPKLTYRYTLSWSLSSEK